MVLIDLSHGEESPIFDGLFIQNETSIDHDQDQVSFLKGKSTCFLQVQELAWRVYESEGERVEISLVFGVDQLETELHSMSGIVVVGSQRLICHLQH